MALRLNVVGSMVVTARIGVGEAVTGVDFVMGDVGVTCIGVEVEVGEGVESIDGSVTVELPHPTRSRANNTSLNTC